MPACPTVSQVPNCSIFAAKTKGVLIGIVPSIHPSSSAPRSTQVLPATQFIIAAMTTEVLIAIYHWPKLPEVTFLRSYYHVK